MIVTYVEKDDSSDVTEDESHGNNGDSDSIKSKALEATDCRFYEGNKAGDIWRETESDGEGETRDKAEYDAYSDSNVSPV